MGYRWEERGPKKGSAGDPFRAVYIGLHGYEQ
jgi:hypothetical protein